MVMYKYRFDADGKAHEITKMETAYICNCLKQLEKMSGLWHGVIPEQLTPEELTLKNEVGMKAWFVFNGIEYIGAFCEELDRRNQTC